MYYPDNPMPSRLITDPIHASEVLDSISRRLNLLGMMVAIGLVTHIMIFALMALFLIVNAPWDLLVYAVIVSLFVFLINMIIIILYETLKRRGEALFLIINDEFQRFNGNPDDSQNNIGPIREILFTVRQFPRAADLPFIPGRFGTSIAILLNVMAVSVFLVMVFKLRPL